MNKSRNLNSTLFFAALLILITVGAIFINIKNGKQINTIMIEGNNHLTSEQYLKFAGLNNLTNLKDLNLRVIKDRIEKHPYVNKADVILDGKGDIHIKLKEKDFSAILISKNSKYLITDKLEILPHFQFTANLDLPVILNPEQSKGKIKLNSVTNNIEIKNAIKIINAIYLYDQNTFENLSTIDLNNGGDIIITLSNMECTFIVGSENVVEKALYLCDLVNSIDEKKTNKLIAYVDLRFDNHVYLGTKKKNGLDKEHVL